MLTKNEYLILSLMWKENRPVTRAEILKGTEGRDWNPASIHLILNSMISKGAIKITDESTKYGRTYKPEMTYREYLMETLREAVPNKPLSNVVKDCADIYKSLKKGEKQ